MAALTQCSTQVGAHFWHGPASQYALERNEAERVPTPFVACKNGEIDDSSLVLGRQETLCII